MIERCADAVTDWLISHYAVEEQDRELYVYAVYSFLMTISPLLLSLIFGIMMGMVMQSIILIIPFMVIRKYSGGFHAKNAWSCLICSCLLLILCISMTSYIKCGFGLTTVTVMALGSLMVCSPVDSENRRLELHEKKRYKYMTIVLVFAFELLSAALYLFHMYTYVVCISIGIILAAGLQIPCIFHLFKVKSD
ncbi:MAG: accessory gene regulator B family protein [Lachnospiraceae bacterium]|nr:accessory gene regulator B family protein [Lachnospiraceae bacterium]